MFNPYTLEVLVTKCIVENDIPFQELPNLLHQDIKTLHQIKQCREEEQNLSQKLEILDDEMDQCSHSAISCEMAAYALDITTKRQWELIEESEFFYTLCYKIDTLVEEYKKKLDDVEEEEGLLIATLPPEFYKIKIKLKDLPNYNDTKQTVIELLEVTENPWD